MMWLLYLTIFINIILIPIYIINTIIIMKNLGSVKTKANLGAFSAAVMCTYLFLLIITSIIGAIFYSKYCLLLLIFVLATFVIGYFVKYKYLKFYSILQTLSYCLSLITLLILI